MYQPTYLPRPHMVKSPFFKADFCASLLAKIRGPPGFCDVAGCRIWSPSNWPMCSSKRRILWGKSWPSWPSRPSWLLWAGVFFFFCIFFLKQRHGFTTWYTVDILYNTLVVFKMFHPSTNGILSRYWAHFWRIESFTCFHFGLSNPPRIRWRKKSASTNHACERNPFIQSGPSKPKKSGGFVSEPIPSTGSFIIVPIFPYFFFVICFFFNSKSSKQPQVAFGLGVAFLVTQQLPWAFSLLGALVIDGLCSVLKKVIDEPRPPGSYREGPGMPSHWADRKAVKVPPQKGPMRKNEGKNMIEIYWTSIFIFQTRVVL